MSTEPSNADLPDGTVAAAPSRAARVLEQLAREGEQTPTRRSWRLRQLPPEPLRSLAPWSGPAVDMAEQDPDGPVVVRPRRAARSRPWLVVVVGTAVVAFIAAAVLARRPPAIEERLPMVAAVPAERSEVDRASGEQGSGEQGSGEQGADGQGADGQGPGERDGGEPDAAQLVVHVAGAVSSPGVVRLASGARVVDAVGAAGGLRADADPDRVNLAAPLTDGQRVVVPIVGQPAPSEVPTGAPTSPASGPDGADGMGSSTGPVDLNAATAEQLDTLPGIGPATAEAILEHRRSNGPFRSVDELLDVRGIGESKLEALRDLVTVGA